MHTGLIGILQDNTLYIALVLLVFIILFGTRSIDASEKHEGLVAAVAFEFIIILSDDGVELDKGKEGYCSKYS